MKNCSTSFKRTGLSSSGAKQPTTTKAEDTLSKTQENKRDKTAYKKAASRQLIRREQEPQKWKEEGTGKENRVK